MRATLSSGLSGLIFGIGLGISGMTQPEKVIAFLDLVDQWDPSLALVMVGAIAVHLVLYRAILRRESPLFAARFAIPTRTDVDPRLVIGSGLFGVGWAVGGFCPGPALVSAASLGADALIFVAAMTAGMILFHVLEGAWTRRSDSEKSVSLESSVEGGAADSEVGRHLRAVPAGGVEGSDQLLALQVGHGR